MTVEELIEVLRDLDPTAVVVLSSDAEGNAYRLLENVDEGFYDKNDLVYYSEDEFFGADEDVDDDYVMDDDSIPHGIPCVALWPRD